MIDVAIGGGEFGRGFYTQTSVGNAMRWASGRSPNQAAVLQLDILDVPYQSLNPWVLTLSEAQQLTAKLRRNGEEGTWLRGRNVLVGPLNGQIRISQQKFESILSQNLCKPSAEFS